MQKLIIYVGKNTEPETAMAVDDDFFYLKRGYLV